MTQVKIPRQHSEAARAGRIDSGSLESSQNSSNGSFTAPSSEPESSHTRAVVPRGQFSFRFSPDTVLQSIEQGSTSDTIYNVSTPSASAARIPSLSLTPSGPTSDHISTPTSEVRSFDRENDTAINILDAQLEGLRFSTARPSMDMSGVSDALQAVATGKDGRASPLLEPVTSRSLSPSPRRLSAHRRRSSSQNNLEVHDVRNEAPPNDRFNIPAVQIALRDTKRMMSELVDVLGSSAVHNESDSVMQRLHRQAGELAGFQCPSTRTVGFVGDSGAGKSSLLNSLLDCRDLARASNGGSACTCVVTEYHYHEDRELTIEAERFSEDEVKPQLENLLRDYRHFHLNKDSFESHEVKDLEERANLARDTFQAMFGGLFVNQSTLLRDTESEALSTIQSWVRNFDPSVIPERRVDLSLKECSSILMRLTSEDESAEGATIWPWLKKIKVYVNAHILSKGLVLVDLPGLRDLNSARRHITERYLLKCNEIFVVANIGRATTDEGVQSVFKLAKKARLSNVGIICTKSDDIKPQEAQKDWKGQKAKEIQRKLDIIAHEESEIDCIECEVSEFDDIDNGDLSDEERHELNLLHSKLRSASKRRNEHEFDLQRFLITNRNAINEKKLIDRYKHEVPGNLLKVFCASNTIYWDHRSDPRDKARPYLILSGILAIREHCMTMVSESQYSAVSKYMQNDIALLLGELGLWVQSGQGSLSAERKESIRSTIDTLERKLYLELRGHRSALNSVAKIYKTEFDTKLYRPQGSHVSRWSATARSASDDWSCWSQATYAAFCRNYGTHCTAAVGSRSWNEEMIEGMTNDLSPSWEKVRISLDHQAEDTVDLIDDLFGWAVQFLDTELDESPDTAVSLISTLLSQKRVLEAEIGRILNDLQDDLRTLRADALSSHQTSFIGKAMEKAYEDARRESGKGSHARKKAIINAAVIRDGLFADLLKDFKKEFNEHAENTQDSIGDFIDSQFESIRNTFTIVRNDNVALECEKDPEFRSRVQARVEAMKDEMESIYTVIRT
ncbi:hypothetical protein HD806DRAFT_505075 [Xylariaceae sp. AK1471]|nr:hypothetical protein HD806DRAFT_505075 [Xylariaceae sp. AK1471]